MKNKTLSSLKKDLVVWLHYFVTKHRYTPYWWLRKNAFNLLILVVLVYVVHQKNLSIAFNSSSRDFFTGKPMAVQSKDDRFGFSISDLLGGSAPQVNKSTVLVNNHNNDGNVGNTYSNVSFWGGKSITNEKRAEKRAKQLEYVDRFLNIAKTEKDKFGIPVSIVLAQGLLESNAGDSKLSVNNNNHFGMKCFSRRCKKGHCSNFTDDSHKDFFRKYQSPWQSYREHSMLIVRGRYRQLLSLDKKDYKNWAYGLKNLGYATDKYYAESLINTIEDLQLYRYD